MLILPLRDSNGIVPRSIARVNQEFLCAIRSFAASDAAVARIPATCNPTHLGWSAIPRTIRGGNGGKAAFGWFGGAPELPLLAGQRPMAETVPRFSWRRTLCDPTQSLLAHLQSGLFRPRHLTQLPNLKVFPSGTEIDVMLLLCPQLSKSRYR